MGSHSGKAGTRKDGTGNGSGGKDGTSRQSRPLRTGRGNYDRDYKGKSSELLRVDSNYFNGFWQHSPEIM